MLIVDPDTQRVIVEGVNRVVPHTKVGQETGRQDRRPDPHRGTDPHFERDGRRRRGKATKVGRRDSVEKRRADGTTYEGTRRVRVPGAQVRTSNDADTNGTAYTAAPQAALPRTRSAARSRSSFGLDNVMQVPGVVKVVVNMGVVRRPATAS